MHKVITSLKYACFGLSYCFATQRNMIIHAVIAVLVLIIARVLQVSLVGFLFLLTAIVLVLVAETFNTALEKSIDLFTGERNKLARSAKDIAAGAVLLASIYAVIVGLMILGPPIWKLLLSVLFSIPAVPV